LQKKLFVSIVIFIKEVDTLGFKVWMQKRLEAGPLYGLMEFPGGKIEIGEEPVDAAIREVHEEVGVSIAVKENSDRIKPFKLQHYETDAKSILLYVYLSNFTEIPAEKGVWKNVSYSTKSQPFKGEIPEINHVIVDDLTVYIEKLFRSEGLDLLWAL